MIRFKGIHDPKKILLYYLDVNNKTEFIERQFRLNDKTFNDFNGIQKQLDLFPQEISCHFPIFIQKWPKKS